VKNRGALFGRRRPIRTAGKPNTVFKLKASAQGPQNALAVPVPKASGPSGEI